MNSEKNLCILPVISGSSSLKFALYHMRKDEKLLSSGIISDINLTTNNFLVKDGNCSANEKMLKVGGLVGTKVVSGNQTLSPAKNLLNTLSRSNTLS